MISIRNFFRSDSESWDPQNTGHTHPFTWLPLGSEVKRLV